MHDEDYVAIRDGLVERIGEGAPAACRERQDLANLHPVWRHRFPSSLAITEGPATFRVVDAVSRGNL